MNGTVVMIYVLQIIACGAWGWACAGLFGHKGAGTALAISLVGAIIIIMIGNVAVHFLQTP